MMYQAYQTYSDALMPLRSMARTAGSLAQLVPGFNFTNTGRNANAAWEMTARARLSHARPSYQIDEVLVDHELVPVREEILLSLPFCDVLHFAKDSVEEHPKVLVVAPLSGHFSTLLRKTVETLLSDHDVYITDWKNARDVAESEGEFGFDDYVQYVIDSLEAVGPDTHVLAVCQPCVQALAAVSLMEEDRNPATPLSLTLMAGPIDTRVDPTAVNELAMSKPIDWFERNLISRVPYRFKGAGRRVYPGFIQLMAFMSMNAEKHKKTHMKLFDHIAEGRTEEAKVITDFYDEYCAVLDMPAEFYIETVKTVFQDALLAKGELTVKGRKIDPRAIQRTALLTIEGERDDICSVGQTAAAHEICSSLRPHLRRHHLQAGVGHYGTFSGKRWEHQIYPVFKNLVLANS